MKQLIKKFYKIAHFSVRHRQLKLAGHVISTYIKLKLLEVKPQESTQLS